MRAYEWFYSARIRFVATCVAILLAANGLQAATEGSSGFPTNLVDLNLEELMEIPIDTVYGASKHDQKVTQAPSSVSIVTAAEIKKYGCRTLADVLRSVPGIYISDDRNHFYVGIRGFLRPGDYNTRMLMLIDGHRMNDNIHDAYSVGREDMVDIDLIDRVEVIRGPSSSIYGSSAFFGVINIITKRARQMDGVEVSGEAGAFDTYKERFSFGRTFENGVEWLMSGSYYTSDGQNRLYYPEFDQRISPNPRATHNGVAKDADGEEELTLFSSLRQHDFTLSGLVSSRTKEVPTASFGTLFNDGREQTTTYRGYADLKYDHGFSDDSRLLARVFYDNLAYDGDYPLNLAAPGDPPTTALTKNGFVGEWAGTEWQLSTRVLDRHTLTLGAEYRENLRQYQYMYTDVHPHVYSLKDDRSSRTVGLFAQDEVAILTNLLLNAGLRYDYYFGGFGGSANPRMGLIYNPWKTTTFKALYGQAFRAPNAYESHHWPLQSSRPELEPETIRTYELVCEQYIGRCYRISVSGYHYDTEDLIVQTATSEDVLLPYYFDNLASANAQGVEFEVEGTFDSGVLARASYTWQETENGETGEELSCSPRHMVKANLSLPLHKDKLFISPELQYQSETRTLTGGKADGFLIANLTLFSPHVTKDLEISASVYNLFDTEYAYSGARDHAQEAIEQDGRGWRVKLTYRF